QFHKYIYTNCPFYGRNLDALWDVFTGGFLDRPAHLIWYDSKISEEVLGETFHKIIEMFEEVRIHDEDLCQRLPQFWQPDEKFTYELR
ncbi:MAG: barstar family protein, partial [Neisseriaceae bacterium]|nr:barstar family protein [Neisseriaceae bacterium]